MAQLYKVQHRTCGHIGAVGNGRQEGERLLAGLQAAGNHGWRLLAIAGKTEVEQVLAALVLDEKCGTCRVSAATGVVTSTGVKVDTTTKAHQDIADPGPGRCVMAGYWLSWWHARGMGPFELRWPWWVSGSRDDADSICAAVRADSKAHAWDIIRASYDQPPAALDVRFIEELKPGVSPYTDRFPKADWMPDWPVSS